MTADPPKRARARRGWRWAAGLVVLWLVLRWFEHHQVFHPSRRMDATGRELGRPVEDMHLETADQVRLHGWFFPADAGSTRSNWVFLLLHGNAGNISHRLGHVDLLLESGCGVAVIDYRGYGRSEGRPSETGTYRDAEAAHDWLTARGFPARQIVPVGESLGGAVATELARRRPVGGLVLLSTFTSIPDLGAELFPWLPVRWLGRIRYDTVRKLPEIEVPVLILHSRGDTLARFQHAERNFAAARAPKQLRELAGDHNDFLETSARAYAEAVAAFLRPLTADGAPPTGPAPATNAPLPDASRAPESRAR